MCRRRAPPDKLIIPGAPVQNIRPAMPSQQIGAARAGDGVVAIAAMDVEFRAYPKLRGGEVKGGDLPCLGAHPEGHGVPIGD